MPLRDTIVSGGTRGWPIIADISEAVEKSDCSWAIEICPSPPLSAFWLFVDVRDDAKADVFDYIEHFSNPKQQLSARRSRTDLRMQALFYGSVGNGAGGAQGTILLSVLGYGKLLAKTKISHIISMLECTIRGLGHAYYREVFRR